jgi:two-component system cell cycle sensor histidine kinase/response regulator CckA
MLEIMIIEDEKDHFELMEHAIKKEFPDAVVELCEKADLCLHSLEESGKDIIIADYLLCGMTGIELFEELKRREIDIPVIVVTDYGNENIAVRAMKLGAFNYVVKTGDFFEFIPELIRRALRERELKAKMRPAEEKKKKKRLQTQLQQAQKMEAIATLAGGIAHQFNNALSSITGHTGLLEMEFSDNKKILGYIEAMKASARRMAKLTDQLLSYARGGKYNPQPLSLGDFVKDSLLLIQHTIDPAIRVETDLSLDIPDIEADRTQMQMVLSAIVVNSNEAIEGPGRIKIITGNEDIDKKFAKHHPGFKPGSYVCLTIEDDGKGMDEETRSRIFEPFFTTHFIGRGLSMAAVYGIVKSHDGWIWVDSELGKGTAVRIYFPPFRVKKEEIEVEEKKTELIKGIGTILVIEDEEPLIELNRIALEISGYHVLEARTGREAVKLAKTFDGDIDLAILDIALPDMNGREVYARIKEARPDLKVIVCSGYDIYGPAAEEIMCAGAQSFIQKPYNLVELSEKVKDVLVGR